MQRRSPWGRTAALRLLAIACLTLAIAGTTAATSQAGQHVYCNWQVGANSWCSDWLVGTYNNNIAYADGLDACERGINPADNSQISLRCGVGLVSGGSDYGWYFNNFIMVRTHSRNDTNARRLVIGRANYPDGLMRPGAPTTTAFDDAIGALAEAPRRTLISSAADRETARLVVRGELLCLETARFGALACFEEKNVAADTAAVSVACSPSLSPGRVALFGVTSDEVRTVAAVLKDGSAINIPLTGNVYAIELPANVAGSITEIRRTFADGRTVSGGDHLPDDLSCS